MPPLGSQFRVPVQLKWRLLLDRGHIAEENSRISITILAHVTVPVIGTPLEFKTGSALLRLIAPIPGTMLAGEGRLLHFGEVVIVY